MPDAGAGQACGPWEPSPILVKEARQAVRSWSLPAVLRLLLCVLAGTSLLWRVAALRRSGRSGLPVGRGAV